MARIQEDGNFFDDVANMDQAFGSNVTAGSLLVVIVDKLNVTGSSDPFLLADVSKQAGTATIGTIQMDVDREFLYDGGTNYIAAAVYSALITGSGSLTMRSVLGSNQYGNIALAEYGGTWDASRVEDTAEDDDLNSGVNPPSTGDMTSAGAAVFVGALADVATGGENHVEDVAWSLIYEQNDTAHMIGSFIDRIVGSGTTDAASWTAPVNDNPWAAVGVVYKEALGGGATAEPAGVEGNGAAGTVVATGNANIALTGVEAASAVGTLTAVANTASVTLVAVSSTGNAGTLTALGPAVAVTFRTLINLTNEGGEVYAATSAGTSQGARGYTDPTILPSGADGWIEASKGAGGDGAIILTLDAAVPSNVAYGGGDFIGQVNTAGSLLYGVNTASLTAVPTYVLPDSLSSLIRLRRVAGTVTFESSEDAGATWTVRNTFAGTSTAALVPRWYTTYSVTPRRIYRPRAYGLVDAIGNAIQGQWVAPNIVATTNWLYVGTAGLAGQYYITRMSRTTLVGVTTTLATDESDDHNVPAIIETNTGKIMVAFATHSLDEFVRSRLSATADLDDWGSVRTLTTSDTATYMQVHRLAATARIWMLYRIGSSSAGDWVMRYSDDEGATWSTERVLAPNTYVISVMDPDGVHIRCFAYAHPLVGTDHDIYYFRVDLSTGDVIDSEGTVYGNVVTDTGLPITEAEQHKAVDVTDPTTTRMYELGRVGVPQVLASEFTDQNSGTYYRYVYDTATTLFTRQAITTSGPAFFDGTSDYFGGACFDEADTDIVYCARNVGSSVGAGSWQLVRMVTTDGGDTWTEDEILRASSKIIARPQVRYGQLWWSEIPTYNDYTSFSSSLHFLALESSASIELTGVAATGAAGALSTGVATALSGTSATGAVGSVSEAHGSSLVLGAVSATGQAEDIAPPVHSTIEIIGVAATGSPGTVSVMGGAAAALSGVESAGEVGSIFASTGAVVVPLIGVSATGAVGTLTESHDSTLALTGLAADGLAGTVEAFAAAVIIQLTGVQSTSAIGTLDVSADASVLLAGVTGTGAVGDLLALTAVLQSLTGVEATGAVGTLAANGSVIAPLTGVSAVGSAGTVVMSFGAAVNLSGVEAAGIAGSLAASIGFAPIAPAHRTLRVPARSRYIRV